MSELEPVTPENSTQPAKRGQKEKPKKTLKREIFEWVVTIAAAVLIAFVIRTFLFEPVREMCIRDRDLHGLGQIAHFAQDFRQ